MDEPKQADRRETDEMHRQAYNAAFEELGLSWHWDAATYAAPAGARPRTACAPTSRRSSRICCALTMPTSWSRPSRRPRPAATWPWH